MPKSFSLEFTEDEWWLILVALQMAMEQAGPNDEDVPAATEISRRIDQMLVA